jgi:hypothetical protein
VLFCLTFAAAVADACTVGDDTGSSSSSSSGKVSSEHAEFHLSASNLPVFKKPAPAVRAPERPRRLPQPLPPMHLPVSYSPESRWQPPAGAVAPAADPRTLNAYWGTASLAM